MLKRSAEEVCNLNVRVRVGAGQSPFVLVVSITQPSKNFRDKRTNCLFVRASDQNDRGEERDGPTIRQGMGRTGLAVHEPLEPGRYVVGQVGVQQPVQPEYFENPGTLNGVRHHESKVVLDDGSRSKKVVRSKLPHSGRVCLEQSDGSASARDFFVRSVFRAVNGRPDSAKRAERRERSKVKAVRPPQAVRQERGLKHRPPSDALSSPDPAFRESFDTRFGCASVVDSSEKFEERTIGESRESRRG